jgi:hypothetical protein
MRSSEMSNSLFWCLLAFGTQSTQFSGIFCTVRWILRVAMSTEAGNRQAAFRTKNNLLRTDLSNAQTYLRTFLRINL